MPPTLIIEASDGSTKQTIPCDSVQRTATRGEMDRAQAVVPRSEWDADTVDARTDRLYIDRADGSRMFGGRFDDDEPGGASVTVTLVSFERDAVDAEPTDRGLTFQNVADDTVVQDAIDGVPSLSAGAIAQTATGLSFSFPNAARSKQIRKVTTATGAEVRYNADRTVDYQSRLGSDLALTISPSNQNVVGEPRVQEDARDEVTHIRGFGSREGNLVAEAVASSYSSGRQVWREFEDTDIKDSGRLQTIIDRMVDDYDGEPRKLVVEATLIGVDVQRGDRVTVSLPERGIDRQLRITKLVERIGERGQEFVATLTNREVDQELEGNPRESLQRFNRGYQGFVDRDQVTSGWNVAGDGNPQTLVIPAWPDDIVTEERVELTVQGRAWRSPVDITSHTHTISGSTGLVPGQGESAIVSAGGQTTVSAVGTTDLSGFNAISTTGWPYLVKAGAGLAKSSSDQLDYIDLYLEDDQGNSWTIAQGPQGAIGGVGQVSGTHAIYEDLNGRSVKLRATTNTDSGSSAPVEWNVFISAIGPHSHSISETSTATNAGSAKVTSSFGGSTYYPRGVDISVNGTYLTTLSGATSDWQETVDLTGELSPGQNTIEAGAPAMTQRGSLNLTLASELFRRGPTTAP